MIRVAGDGPARLRRAGLARQQPGCRPALPAADRMIAGDARPAALPRDEGRIEGPPQGSA